MSVAGPAYMRALPEVEPPAADMSVTERPPSVNMDYRRSPRVPFRAGVLLVARDDDAEVPVVTRDISVSGVFVELPLPHTFWFGQEVFLWLRFPGQQIETPLVATIRWIEAQGLGLQFQPMGARETHAITEIVRGAWTTSHESGTSL